MIFDCDTERGASQRLGAGATLIRRRQPSSSTVQPFCFTLSQRLIGPPSYVVRQRRAHSR